DEGCVTCASVCGPGPKLRQKRSDGPARRKARRLAGHHNNGDELSVRDPLDAAAIESELGRKVQPPDIAALQSGDPRLAGALSETVDHHERAVGRKWTGRNTRHVALQERPCGARGVEIY